jgi:hypothetical protein
MKRLMLGLVAAVLVATLVLVGSGKNTPAESATSNATTLLSIGFTTPQINTFMYNAWIEGDDTASFWQCAAATGNIYTTAFSDCYGMLTWLSSYSFPIMQYTAYIGRTVIFRWFEPANTYDGYVIL